MPSTVVGNIERIAALGVNLVIGTTGWQEQMPHVREASWNSRGIGLVWSPNYSVGVNAFFRIVNAAAKLLANEPEYEAWAWEIHHSAKKDAPSGTLLKLVDEMRERRLCAPRGCGVEPRGSHSRYARDRIRFRGGYNHFAAHRAQPRRVRAGRHQSRRMGRRQERVFTSSAIFFS